MKFAVIVVLLAVAVLAGLSTARTLLSREQLIHEAKVIAFIPQAGNEARNVPLPGDIVAKLETGKEVRFVSNSDEELKAGTAIRVSERVAPWGEVWYRLAQ